MFWIVIAAWLVGVIVSFIYQNRKLPITIFVLGAATIGAHFEWGLGFGFLIIMAVLSIIIWISNKFDMI